MYTGKMPLVRIVSSNNIYYDDHIYNRIRAECLLQLYQWLVSNLPITVIWDCCNIIDGYRCINEMCYEIQYSDTNVITTNYTDGTITMND